MAVTRVSRHGEGTLRVGCGAGQADDRIAPAVQLLETGELDYFVCECLAERTIARETLDRKRTQSGGFNPMLAERARTFMPLCREHGIRLITNMGAANPIGAANAFRHAADAVGVPDVSVAAVTGDDVIDLVSHHPELRLIEGGEPLESILPTLASANAYLGADTIRDALDTGAEVVMAGRVADPSLFLGVGLHHHAWSYDDLPSLAAGTVAGHLLECSAQITGGYFADPGRKDVPRLAEVPYPFADLAQDGRVAIGKPRGSGGRLDRMTFSEQALYEVHDPARYITPDCVLDFMDISFEEVSPDRVLVHGARACPRTRTYKAVVGYFDGYIGVGEMTFAGINALARARLAAEVVQDRFHAEGGVASEIQVDLVGISSLHGDPGGGTRPEPYEVRLRIAGRCPDQRSAQLLGDHVNHLIMHGPVGAGGPMNFGAKEIIAVNAVLIPRNWVRPSVTLIGGRT
jgi:hypothetical protein